jgi:hypothetical protein
MHFAKNKMHIHYMEPFHNNIIVRKGIIEFTNSSKVKIFFNVLDEGMLYHLYFYLCCNEQLRLSKKQMETKTQRNPLESVFDFFQKQYNDQFQRYFSAEWKRYTDVPSELNSLTKGKKGFESKCASSFSKNKCDTTLAAWAAESRSISYMLLSMAQSFISRKNTEPINITVKRNGSLSTNVNDEIYRTIWGVGPSGCGKSFMTSQITPFIEVDTVLAIDGGIVRECSNVWMVATTDHELGENIKDLYDQFKSKANVKNVFESMFKQVQCSLYIPDTLVSTYYNSFNPLKPSVSKYMSSFSKRQLKGKELPYVGICIMQHCITCDRSSGCTFPQGFKCIGCDTSGSTRAHIEGKSYSNTTYDDALSIGYNTMFVDETLKSTFPMFIHNSGSPNQQSVLALLKDKKYDKMATSLSRGMFKVIRIDSFPARYDHFEQLVLQTLSETIRFAELPAAYSTHASLAAAQPNQQTEDEIAAAKTAAAIKLQSNARGRSQKNKFSRLKEDDALQREAAEQQALQREAAERQAAQQREAAERQAAQQREAAAASEKEFLVVLNDTNKILSNLAGRLNNLRPNRKKTRGFFWGGRRGTRKRIRGGINGIDKYEQLIKLERNQLKLLISIFQKYPNLEENKKEIPIEMLTKFLKGFKEVSEFLAFQIALLEEKEQATPRQSRSRRWFFQR